MSNYALHDGSRVVNVILAESQEVAESVTGLTALETEGEPWIGWTLSDGVWVAPPQPEPEFIEELSDASN
jgi:hypothetical protein